ncbi:HAD family hydrolase [Rossellomorea sp. y25]|uniref:HAD family hydrolase n=2 Tax=Rossellomorea TaxID=2837508 RepID=UPI0030E08509
MEHLDLGQYDLLLFDLDDTLFDHSEAFENGLVDTIQQFHYLQEIGHSEFIQTFTKHNHLLWPRFSSNELNFHEFSLIRIKNTLKELNVSAEKEISLKFVKIFQSSYLDRIKPYQELNEFLFELSYSVGLGIVTNGTVFNAFEKVDRLGLCGIFPGSSVIVSEKLGFSKPNIEIFQYALNVFGSTADRTLFIGDNYFTDILGAKSLGLDTLWINKYEYECPQKEQPDYMLRHLIDLKNSIKQ